MLNCPGLLSKPHKGLLLSVFPSMDFNVSFCFLEFFVCFHFSQQHPPLRENPLAVLGTSVPDMQSKWECYQLWMEDR